MIFTLFLLALCGGFLSGLLGLGGAVVMIPLMLSVPPLVGVGTLTMKTVAGLSMLQVLAASLSGILIHKKNHFVHIKTLLYTGIPMGICALIGSYFSKYMDDRLMLIIFGILVLLAFVMLLLKKSEPASHPTGDEVQVNSVLAVLVGVFVGFMAGVVGAGGGFIMVPLMLVVLKLPIKVTVGTSLGVVFIGAIMGSLGKILSLQVDLALAVPVILGSIPAARFGASVSKNLSPRLIKYLLLAVVLFSLGKVCWELFTS
jgi:uncharacterized protein